VKPVPTIFIAHGKGHCKVLTIVCFAPVIVPHFTHSLMDKIVLSSQDVCGANRAQLVKGHS
jgi:hypothetical protein